jgi:hypothetical protein
VGCVHQQVQARVPFAHLTGHPSGLAKAVEVRADHLETQRLRAGFDQPLHRLIAGLGGAGVHDHGPSRRGQLSCKR